MNKKIDLSGIATDSSKMADFLEKTREKVFTAIDQNDDGKFNMKDIAIVADAIGNVTRKTASSIKDSYDEKNSEMEMKLLQPNFVKNLDSADFLYQN